MEGGDQVASIIDALHALTWVTVSFLPMLFHFAELMHRGFIYSRDLMVNSTNGNTIYISDSRSVVASTMLIWDYILTFRMEVDLVWKSKWNFVKGLYFFQRYLPFIDTPCLVLYRLSDAFSLFLL
jgi:hypothetical protein